MNRTRLAIAIEQVETAAKDMKVTPLEVVANWDHGSTAQQEIYKAVKEKHSPAQEPKDVV